VLELVVLELAVTGVRVVASVLGAAASLIDDAGGDSRLPAPIDVRGAAGIAGVTGTNARGMWR
jgi:hypothetical protein